MVEILRKIDHWLSTETHLGPFWRTLILWHFLLLFSAFVVVSFSAIVFAIVTIVGGIISG